jgi:hypothetical protein
MGDDWHVRLHDALIHEYQFGPTYIIEPQIKPEPKIRELSMHPRAVEKRDYLARRQANGGTNLRGTAVEKKRPKKPDSEKSAGTPWRAHGTLKARVKPVVVIAKTVPRLAACESCGREFGADRQRHWFNENICSSCHQREYA